jgi:hypothetical protein
VIGHHYADSVMNCRALFIGVIAALAQAAVAQVAINEIRTGSANAEYIELTGTPGASLAGMSIVVIGDGTTTGTAITRTGVVEWLYHFAATDVIGKNGFLVLRNPGDAVSGAFPFTVAAGATDLPWPLPVSGLASDTQIESPDNQTYLLVTGYSGTDTFVTKAPNTGSGGQDLDVNDDGVLDITPWTSIVDNVVLKETNGGTPLVGQDWWYGTNFCGPYISRTLVQVTTGTTIAGWDFQTTATGGTAAAAAPNTPRLFNANAGSGRMYLDGTNGSSSWLASELNALTGTSINATGTGPGGNGLDPATNATSCLTLVGSSANGKAIVFEFSMENFAGVNPSYATRTSGVTSGFNAHQWAWSDDGSNWTDIDLFSAFSTTFVRKQLEPLDALGGSYQAYLRLTFTGATTVTSNNRLDNVLLLSNAVDTESVLFSYSGPTHSFRTSSGTWAIGTASATASPMDTVGSGNLDPATYACGDVGAGDCGTAHVNAHCASNCCCEFVCSTDPFCCDVRWDSICVSKASDCASTCVEPDADGDGIRDDLDNCPAAANPSQADCNLNGIGDACDGAPDCNANGTPDSCELQGNDCNASGSIDSCDIASGFEQDVNSNAVPDSCECLGDIFVDAIVNGGDLGVLLSQWGPATSATASDLNRDGRVDGADLGVLLVNWGACR